MMGVFGRLLGVMLLVFLLISMVGAIVDNDTESVVIRAGFFIGSLVSLQLDYVIGYLRGIHAELKRQGVR